MQGMYIHMHICIYMPVRTHTHTYICMYMLPESLFCPVSPLSALGEKALSQWLRLWQQVGMWQQDRILILEERSLHPPPASHWFLAILSSKWQFSIGSHYLCHQYLGSQVGFSLALMWKFLPHLCGPT